MCVSRSPLSIAIAVLLLGVNHISAIPALPSETSDTILESRDNASTWHTTLEIGSSQVGYAHPPSLSSGQLLTSQQWHIGDAVSQHFEDNYMKNICSSTGCDGGSPMSFKYLTKTDGYSSLGTGTITMTGNSDDNIDVIDQMLDRVETALVASSDCTFNVKANHCIYNSGPADDTWTKRESASIAADCGEIIL